MSNPHQDTRAYPTLSQRMMVDARVSPALKTCTRCHAELPDAQTVGNRDMMLFAQCQNCKTVFILDFASFLG